MLRSRNANDHLTPLPLFAGLDKHQATKVTRLGTPVGVKPGRVLTEQGRAGTEFFVIVSGFARCDIDSRVVARFGPGDWFGEVALLDGGPRTATVTVVTPMEVIVFTSREFVSLLQASGELALRVMSELSGRLREANVA